MSATTHEWHERLLDALGTVASARTGVRADAIRRDHIHDVVHRWRARGFGPERILTLGASNDPELCTALEQATAVGETYFFRQPEHFALLAGELGSRGDEPVRAWCAGCATGEEAHSLAATLAFARGSVSGLTVLATDLVEPWLDVARAGTYPKRSLRSAPPLFPAVEPCGDGAQLRVLPEIASITTFERHNLLDPAPTDGGPFDVIICRNVLVYFTPSAQRTACANIADALAPGGLALFSPMDVTDSPPGLVRVGAPELQAFRRTAARASIPPPSRLRVRRSVPPPPRRPWHSVTSEDPVGIHVRALAHVERGERQDAQRLLSHLCRAAPAYVPGLLERALLHMREGERKAAVSVMRDVLRRTRHMDPESLLPGPEPLPARYYTALVLAFLERLGVRA